MNFDKEIKLIRSALALTLPGEDAQYLMAPKERKSKEIYLLENTAPRLSGVLILLFPDKNGETQTMFIQRPVNESVHSGQIAFPGGKLEESDADLGATALRETHEEIGVLPHSIELIGPLSTLYIPASNFLVNPFVGMVDFTPEFTPNPDEVKALLPATLNEILNFKVDHMFFKTSYGNLNAPYYKFNEHNMWGATAMIVSEFREVIRRKM